MGGIVDIDEIDEKILRILINDARTRLKDMAQECGISSVSVLNRIKRLKKLKVITGTTLYPALAELGLPVIATIGIHYQKGEGKEILKAIGEQTHLVEPSSGIGEYDLCAFVYATNLNELDKIAYSVRKNFGASKVVINVWSGAPITRHDNIDLNPRERGNHG